MTGAWLRSRYDPVNDLTMRTQERVWIRLAILSESVMSQGSSFSQYQISTKREARASKIVAMISDHQIKRLTNLIWKLVVTFSFVLQVKLTGHYHSLTVLTKSQGGNPLPMVQRRLYMWVNFFVGCRNGFRPGSRILLPPQKPNLALALLLIRDKFRSMACCDLSNRMLPFRFPLSGLLYSSLLHLYRVWLVKNRRGMKWKSLLTVHMQKTWERKPARARNLHSRKHYY